MKAMPMRLKPLLILALALAWCGGVCAPVRPAKAHEAEPGYRKGQIHAIQAWARVSPIKGRPAAVFFTLHNEGKVADTLIKAATPIAKRAEIHTSQASTSGVMKMVKRSSVAVAADDMVLFEPGAYHIMLFDLVSPPKAGTSFPLTLTFAKAPPQTIQVKSKGLVDRQTKPVMDHMNH
jgi:periplasmic copper chaperone A